MRTSDRSVIASSGKAVETGLRECGSGLIGAGKGSHTGRNVSLRESKLENAEEQVMSGMEVGLNGAEKEAFRRAEEDFAATFLQDVIAVPLADKTACGEGSDVGGAGQILIGDLEEDAAVNFLADGAGESGEDQSDAMAGVVAGEGYIRGEMPSQIV
jgi:hypothetical protein